MTLEWEQKSCSYSAKNRMGDSFLLLFDIANL